MTFPPKSARILQYLNARYYDPELSLFLQPDWFEVTKAGVGTNRFSYSFNDPVNKFDPGGNCTNDDNCDGEWKDDKDGDEHQDPEGIQDKFNYGDGSSYKLRAKKWGLDRSMDIGSQILSSIRNPDGRMAKYYSQAKSTGEPVEFEFSNMGFNMDPDIAISSPEWPIGRYSADVVGAISVNEDGSFEVSGSATINSDAYSWKLDGGGFFHNAGIEALGNNINGPYRGDMVHSNLASWYAFSDNPDPGFDGSRIGGSPSGNEVKWSAPSSSLPGGELTVDYIGRYEFEAWGAP